MRLTGFLLALLCAAASLARGQDNADPSSVRSRIIALEKAWNQAYKLGDTKGLDALLDNEMVLINDDGTV